VATLTMTPTAGQDLDLFVFGPSCAATACTQGEFAGGDGEPETLELAAEAGATYYIVVDGWDGAEGAFDLSATCGTTVPVCGNGVVEEGEDCDGDASRACTTTCGPPGTQACTACAWETTCTSSATESCNGTDDDCDTETDEADADGCTAYYLDGDGDGHGVGTETRCLCVGAAPYTGVDALDCNDAEVTVYPGAAPVACSTVDHDCNGHADADNDGDGHTDIACTGGALRRMNCYRDVGVASPDLLPTAADEGRQRWRRRSVRPPGPS